MTAKITPMNPTIQIADRMACSTISFKYSCRVAPYTRAGGNDQGNGIPEPRYVRVGGEQEYEISHGFVVLGAADSILS